MMTPNKPKLVPIQSIYFASVAGFDVSIANETVTVMREGKVRAEIRIPGLADFVAKHETSFKLEYHRTQGADSIRISSPHEVGEAFDVRLERGVPEEE